MKRYSLVLLALAIIVALAPAALADTIQVGSSFSVSGNLNNLNSTTPTLTNVHAFGGTGTFADVTYFPVPAANISLNSGVVGDNFTITVNGKVINFVVSTVTFGPDNTAWGIGTLTETGYDPINARWSETIDSKTGKLTFAFDTNVDTPEPGSLGLLGTGLLTLAGILRRRFS